MEICFLGITEERKEKKSPLAHMVKVCLLKILPPSWDFPGDPVVKNSPCNAGDVGLNLWSGN